MLCWRKTYGSKCRFILGLLWSQVEVNPSFPSIIPRFSLALPLWFILDPIAAEILDVIDHGNTGRHYGCYECGGGGQQLWSGFRSKNWRCGNCFISFIKGLDKSTHQLPLVCDESPRVAASARMHRPPPALWGGVQRYSSMMLPFVQGLPWNPLFG